MFQPVEAFFLSDTLENTFLKCLNTIYVEGAYTRTLNFESGPASENNLESGKVTRGHRNLRSCPKFFPEIFLSWPFNFFIDVSTNQYQKYKKMTRNMKKISLASKIGILPILQECPWRHVVAIFATKASDAIW